MELGTYSAERPQLAKLDEPTQARIRSTQILTTLPQIVSELVQNSLDAKANNISVSVNCAEWMCWVRDDGSGFSKRDLETFSEEDASQRYCTSKKYTPDSTNAVSTYGFRGEALASAAQVSCLEIASRTAKAHTTWSIIKKAHEVLYQGEAIRWRRESPGTVVCVRDAFYNLPVRRLSHPPAAKTWELIRQEVEAYALVSPSVAFVLEDLEKNRGSGPDTRTMRIPKTSSILSTFRHLYGRALSERVAIVDAADGMMRAEGFISLHGASSKIFQFLYINSRPVSLCDLHRLIDIQFSSSSFGKNSFDSRNEVGDTQVGTRRSPRKLEMKPVYVLNVLIPSGEVDNGFDPTKTIVALKDKNSVISFLISIVRGFLVKNNFIHGTSDLRSARRTQTHERPCIRNEVLLDYERNKSSSNQISTWRPLSQETYSDPNLHAPVKPREMNYNLPADASQATELLLAPTVDLEALIGLGRDYSKRRTLHSLEPKSGSQITTPLPTWLCNALAANHSYSLREPKIPVTCSSLLSLPTAECTGGKSSRHQSADLQHFSPQRSISGFYTRSDLVTATIVGQVDLKFIACLIPTHEYGHGEVESTLPNEVAIPNHDALTLVLIDQHAADERIRVEAFLEELCLGFLNNRDGKADPTRRIELRTLAPPKPVLVTWHELRTLQESKEIQEAFQNWGIHLAGYSTPGSGSERLIHESDNRTFAQVLVEAIPEVISDKLLQEDELQNLVKGFLAQLQEDLPSSFSSPNPDQTQRHGEEFVWLKALRYCPKPLLNLVNSKACRGAIMFNDSLSRMQCESLVRRLALTAYPFQCAHGRPSLVPLVELGSPTRNLGQRRKACDWSKLEDDG